MIYSISFNSFTHVHTGGRKCSSDKIQALASNGRGVAMILSREGVVKNLQGALSLSFVQGLLIG